MKRLIQSIAVPIMGILIVISGFVYDILFAGIPYQDPTPALQAQYDFHSSVASWLYKLGGLILLAGLVAVPVILKKTNDTNRNTSLQDR